MTTAIDHLAEYRRKLAEADSWTAEGWLSIQSLNRLNESVECLSQDDFESLLVMARDAVHLAQELERFATLGVSTPAPEFKPQDNSWVGTGAEKPLGIQAGGIKHWGENNG